MSEGRYYSGVQKVKEVTDPSEVNKLLQEGWEILRSGERTIGVYVMGLVGPVPIKPKEAAPTFTTPTATTTTGETVPMIDPSLLDSLPWTLYKGQGSAGWIFSDPNSPKNKGHQALIRLLREEMDKGGGEVQIGDFTYAYSGREGMFISRRPA